MTGIECRNKKLVHFCIKANILFSPNQEASRISLEAGQTKQRAVELLDNAEVLLGDVKDSHEQVDNLKVQADNDNKLAGDVSTSCIY